MLMATRDIGAYVARTVEWLGAAQDRAAQRRRLMTLDDRLLRDIGLTRADVEAEYRKPFWRP